jgi:phospholipid-transporting ATPase
MAARLRFVSALPFINGCGSHLACTRCPQVILYSFYKNITMVATLFFFGFFNGYSGTTLYESWLGAGWNVGWTFMPIIAVGMYDSDVSSSTVMKYPCIYQAGQSNGSFSLSHLAQVL